MHPTARFPDFAANVNRPDELFERALQIFGATFKFNGMKSVAHTLYRYVEHENRPFTKQIANIGVKHGKKK